mgnify:CR=1 FL=1
MPAARRSDQVLSIAAELDRIDGIGIVVAIDFLDDIRRTDLRLVMVIAEVTVRARRTSIEFDVAATAAVVVVILFTGGWCRMWGLNTIEQTIGTKFV